MDINMKEFAVNKINVIKFMSLKQNHVIKANFNG